MNGKEVLEGPYLEQYPNDELDRVRTEISAMLNYEDPEGVPIVDFKLYDTDTNVIHTYLSKITRDQDLPDKLLKNSFIKISDERMYHEVCDYCQIYNAPLSPKRIPRVYFIESADSAVTVIPIQLFDNQVNIHISLLENSPQFIKDMYKNIGKLKMQDIKFTKFQNYK